MFTSFSKRIGWEMKKLIIGMALVGLAAGCATTPWEDESGDICDFEFPFVNDYDIVNKTTFRWDDSYVTNNPAEYRQEIAGPFSAPRASSSVRTRFSR